MNDIEKDFVKALKMKIEMLEGKLQQDRLLIDVFDRLSKKYEEQISDQMSIISKQDELIEMLRNGHIDNVTFLENLLKK